VVRSGLLRSPAWESLFATAQMVRRSVRVLEPAMMEHFAALSRASGKSDVRVVLDLARGVFGDAPSHGPPPGLAVDPIAFDGAGLFVRRHFDDVTGN
jgi:hypothetical protein